ncbi:MAG: EamA family transporter [Clostridia bacterium]|nr:EamA family transporter [Clostridia bacterium]
MKKFADIFVFGAGVLWGIAGLFVSYIGKLGFSPVQVSAMRWITAAILMTLGMLIINPKKLRIMLCDIWWFMCTGILCILLSSTLYFVAIEETSAAVGNILMYTSPIWILIFSIIFFKEKLTVPKLLSLILAIGGCAFATGIIGGAELKFSTYGIIAGVLSGLFYGLYSIFGKAILKKYDSVTVTLYTAIFAGVGALFMIDIPETTSQIINQNAYFPVILLALCVTIAPYTLYTVGLKHCKATRASIMACIEPITSAFMGTIVLGQPFTIFQFMGILMILGAGFILQLKTE